MVTNKEKLFALGRKMTDRIPQKLGLVKLTEEDPEFWGLVNVLDDDMVDIALAMPSHRKPASFEEIKALTGWTDEKKLSDTLFEMSCIGILEYNWENEDHHQQWVLPLFVPGAAEFLNMRRTFVEKHPEVTDFFNKMARLPLEGVTPMVPPGGAGVGMHVIPVEKAIAHESKSVSVEHLSHWLKKYDRFSIGVCSCRMVESFNGRGSGDLPQHWCIAVGDCARYCDETGKDGISNASYEQVMEVLRRAEEEGYVHQITNIDGEDKIFAICNCAIGVCYALRTSQLFNTPNLSASAYRAHVKTENCVACGKCVEVCPAGAVKLGQKLCTKNGPIEYPKFPDPAENHWGPHMWNENYKDDNQINCYDTGTAPCKTACPAHIAVQGYLKLAAQGKYREALQLIKRENPFPAVCGRICNRRCEDACTRGTVDEAVAIDEVKRFIAQQDLDAETRFVPEKVIPKVDGEFSEKIAIIGAGPAGMSCAFYLAERGYRPTVFEKEKRPGGMLMNAIPTFRLEKDVVEAEIDVLREMGVEFRCGVEVGKDVTIPQLREEGFKAFYVAVGLQSGGTLNIPGGNAQGVMSGIDYMRRHHLENDTTLSGRVVVIGGGNIGADVARTVVRCGAESVSLYCLESYDDMPMGVEDRGECEREGISIHAGWGQTEITERDGKCTGIKFRKCLRVKNDEGRFAPEFDDAVTEETSCDVVLYCIGQKADWGTLLTGTKVEFNPNGTAKADPVTYQTAEPDIFVGGDIYTGQKFAIDAIAAGKEGAISLHRYVQNATLTIGRNRRQFIELDKKNALIAVDSYDNTPRQQIGYNETLRKTFRDERVAFTEEQVKKETARCLGCGASIVDPNKCIGCGVCTTKCAFDAIHLHRERPECSTMYKCEDKMKAILPYMIKREFKIKRAARKSK